MFDILSWKMTEMINYQNSFNDKLTHVCSSRTYFFKKINTLFNSQQTTTNYIKKVKSEILLFIYRYHLQ